MKWIRIVVIVFLTLVTVFTVFPKALSSRSYSQQFRDIPDAAPTRQHVLGTDDVGRDRFARLLYGTRVSLLLAPAAALLSTLLAAMIGGFAGFAGRSVEKAMMAVTDLSISLPWLFLLIAVRALLPLNTSPMESVVATFFLLGSLGWAAAARVVCTDARCLRDSDFVLLARASGIANRRLLWRHILPNLKPVLIAQFWISIPVFILTEANLGMLGLGVAEPLPSWGGLMHELESTSSMSWQPWRMVPLMLLVAVVSGFQFVSKKPRYQL